MFKNPKKIKEESIGLAEVHSLLTELNGTPIAVDYKKDGFARRKEVTNSERVQEVVANFAGYAHYSGVHRVYETNGQQRHSIYLEAGLVIGGAVYKPIIEKVTLEYTVNTA